MGLFLVHFLGYSLQSVGEDDCVILSDALCFLLLVHITCAMKLPIFSAALSCICRVTWV